MPEPDELHSDDHRFPCSVCGADLRFDPGTEGLTCDHCGAQEAIEGSGPWGGGIIYELDYRKALANQLPLEESEDVQTSDCPNCGAQVEFDPDSHASECPFCATPIVTDTGSHRQIKPKGLLPFALKEEQARSAMKDWLGSLWFAPNGLKQYARKGRRMKGIYVPYWTYDADTKSRYSGQRGTIYYVTQRVTVMVDGKPRQRTRQVPKIRWTNVRGRVARFFDDVLVLGSRSLPKKYTDGLSPWDLSELEPYQPEFLAGFRAEGYTVALDEGFEEARAYMDRMIVRDVKYDIGGDRQRITNLQTDIGDVTFKHILLPIWLAAYKYRGTTYRFVVNGRTGRVQGERPYSRWKIAFAVLSAMTVAAIAGYIYAVSQGLA